MGDNTLISNDGSVLVSCKLNMYSPAECAELIDTTQGVYEGQAVTGDGGYVTSAESRNTKLRTIYPNSEFDWFFDKMEGLIKELSPQFNTDITGFFEGAQIYEYPVGGFLGWHMDLGKGIMSNRKLSITIQLTDSDLYDGGDLQFLDTRGQAPRQLGAATVFSSYRMHRVSPVTRGFRKSAVTWVHGKPYR